MTRATEAAQRAIIESACEWLVTLHDSPVPSTARRGFASWLLESPIHVREYLAAEVTWSLMADAVRNDEFVVDARNDLPDQNIVVLHAAH